MRRRLATAALVALTGISTNVAAVGLGRIQANSGLNEPLSARIPILSAEDVDLAQMRVGLATAEQFDRADVPRPFYLTRLDFEVERNDDGEVFVTITSERPIQEPFLDFLVNVEWSQGSLLREFTVLLDPPVYAQEQASTPSAAPSTAKAAPAESGTDEIAVEDGGAAASAPGSGGTGTGTAETSTEEATYGPVKASDTLWAIAEEVRPAGANVRQTMIALLRANPEAFIDGNINRLKRGAVLRLPDGDAATRVSDAEARREVSRQMESWRQSQETAPAEAQPQQEQAAADTQTPEGDTSGESGSAQASADADADADGQLRVVAPSSSGGESATENLAQADLEANEQNVSRLQQALTAAEEDKASLESENEDLKAELEALRTELERLEGAVNVSGGGLAEGAAAAGGAQSDTGEAGASMAADEGKAGEDTTTENVTPESGAEAATDGDAVMPGDDAAPDAMEPPGTTGMGEAADTDTAGESASDPGTASPAASDAENAVTSDDAGDGATALDDQAPADQAADEAGADSSAAESQPAESPAQPQPATTGLVGMITDMLLANRLLLLGAGGLILLALMLVMVMRRRRTDSTEGEEALTTGPTTESVSADSSDQAEEERDPIAQADFFLAYGRYESAQDVLDQALGADPDNRALRVKLLEVLARQEDRSGFEAEAQVLYTQMPAEDDPQWQEVVAWGRQVAPEHPLFGGEGKPQASAPAEDTPSFDASPDVDEPTFELPGEGEESDSAATAGESGFPAEDEAFDLDFDLEPGEGETGGRGEYADTQSDDPGAPLEFEPSSADETEDERAPERPASAESSDGLDFELPEAGDDTGVDASGSKRGETQAPADELDEFDFGDLGLDFGDDSASGDASADQATGDGEEELDEVSTKLDLARAYMDMGDAEGARSLLDEVIEEGDDTQRAEAEGLLRKAG
ncbi:FimV/HubP family polar landmark protein [Arhodomonas sp. AD133]|uniref:FimV/HubP family polar landmark protein n=1 Tax=Arhodomonas sp. AD133 TaxID=3415009 RepID=UPI003EBAC01D